MSTKSDRKSSKKTSGKAPLSAAPKKKSVIPSAPTQKVGGKRVEGPTRLKLGKHRVPLKGLGFHACLQRRRAEYFGEAKSGHRLRDETQILESLEDSSYMSDGITPWTSYNVVLKGFSTMTSTTGSTITAFIPSDPSGSGYGFAEWSSLVSLFSEVRILRLTIQLVSYNVTTGANTPVAVGFNPTTSAAPSNEGAVIQLADSEYWACNADRTNRGLKFDVSFDSRLGFSTTSSVTTTPYAGCPGSIQIYGSGFGVSTAYFKVLVMGLYQFRGRQ